MKFFSNQFNKGLHGMFFRALPGCALLVVLFGCSKPPAENLLFISFDTTRADHLSAYGYKIKTSPNIDALAAQGVLFQRAFSHAPSTLPSHASMFTGKLPPDHGVRCNGKFTLPEEQLTLAEILYGNGFETGAVLGAFPLDKRFGLDQGFSFYDDDFRLSQLTLKHQASERVMDKVGFWQGQTYLDFERNAYEVTTLATKWLQKTKGRWFLFVHYFDPHEPYEPPPAWRTLFENQYDAEIAFADRQLGKLLETVNSMPGKTLIVFTADHGQGLGDHGEITHDRYLYDSTQWIPLVFCMKDKIKAGSKIINPVSHIDVMPTILDLLGVPSTEGIQGRSLAKAILAGEDLENKPIYMESLSHKLEKPEGIDVRGLVRDNWKFILTNEEHGGKKTIRKELYDLDSGGGGGGENADLSLKEAGRAAEMDKKLSGWVEKLEHEGAKPNPLKISEETRQKLKSLGYL
ncbi:MAG: sulfatase [Nitrospinae bacterium]|nr:sulfatase [Nitrospinota bacterium]